MTTPASAAGPAAGGAEGGQVTGGQGGTVQPGGGSSAAGQGGNAQGATKDSGKGSDNGLYAEYLEGIPAQLHGVVTQAFQKWDGKVTQQQQGVRSQYAPYQQFVDAGIAPERLQAGADLLDWLQEDPQAGLQLLAGELGVDLGQLVGGGQQQQAAPGAGFGGAGDEGQAGPGDPQGGEIPPWAAQWQTQLQEQQQLLQLLAQERVQELQGKQTEQELDQIEQVLRQAMSGAQIADDDTNAQDYILAQLSLTDENTPVEQAVADAVGKWQQLTSSLGAQRAQAQAPQVLRAGGGLPTQQVDPATLSQTDRRKLAVERVRQLQQGGG